MVNGTPSHRGVRWPTFDKANADAQTRHTTQFFEMMGNRAIYHDGWMASDPA
jgi:arylsulfatase